MARKPSNPKAAVVSGKPKRTTRQPPPPKGKNVGRPTDYKPEFPQQLLSYFEDAALSPYRDNHTKTGIIQFIPKGLPTFEMFAHKLGVDYRTIYRWANEKLEDGTHKHPEFSQAFIRAKELQGHYITSGAMVGANQAAFAALYMKNFHGWQDKIEQEVIHSGRMDLSLIDAELAKAAEERARRQKELEDSGIISQFET